MIIIRYNYRRYCVIIIVISIVKEGRVLWKVGKFNLDLMVREDIIEVG